MSKLKYSPNHYKKEVGWTWDQELNNLPENISKNINWSKIKIVTPSYNQGEFIEETIKYGLRIHEESKSSTISDTLLKETWYRI